MQFGTRTNVSVFALLATFATVIFASAACHQPLGVARIIPGASTRSVAGLSESALNAIVVCHDTLGRPLIAGRVVGVSRCTPCIPYGMQTSYVQSVAHAKRLWQQSARAPYDSRDLAAGCATLAFQYARALRPDDDSLAVEQALFALASIYDTVRARALFSVDSVLTSYVEDGSRERAARVLSQLARGIWDRAQRELERPREIKLNDLEREAHNLARGAPVLRYLPAIPATSSELGVSEAQWAAKLFDAAARMSNDAASRSQRLRLALSPWVVLDAWRSLDSAASAMLQFAPNDSAVLPARALAAYRQMRQPVLESPKVSAAFDTALARLPRVDSVRYDSFDGVLTAEDDQWRYGFYPDQRVTLDERGWTLLDPLWSTPVNELRLERRARVAEADYRYADIARHAESGSETPPGQILMRRGVPAPRWSVVRDAVDQMWLERSWMALTARSVIDHNVANNREDMWRIFYGSHFSPVHTGEFLITSSCTTPVGAFSTLLSCAMNRRSEWSKVPFYGRTDRIDVSIARFRAGGDSADMYIGARIPLRAFKSMNSNDAKRTDRIATGVWLTTEEGAPIVRDSVSRELPPPGLIAWTQQWTHRVGMLRMMHRVEAMEPTRPSGARGAARFTSDAQVTFPLRGFGMSDVLVATAASSRRAARRWSDLTIEPNGATVEPRARFAMVWEVYDLTPGPDNRVRWRVRIKREHGAVVVRSDMKDVLVGSAAAGSKVVADESAAPDMSYVRQGPGGQVMLENIIFNLQDAALGYHVLNVTIDDLVSGQSVTRGVSVQVLEPGSQKRGVIQFAEPAGNRRH